MERVLKAGVVASHRDRLPSSSQYELIVRIASGGMATVYVGRRSGAGGFSRLVAIKRAHAHLVEDATFSNMLVAEAKIAARIHHPNVVAVEAVEILEGEVLLIMDYVEGASLSDLLAVRMLPPGVVTRVILDACAGLHAAHGTCDDGGRPLGLVHRDVSPQNLLVGRDGISRVSDFGIAKSTDTDTGGLTASGTLKGKVGYMPPEYVAKSTFDARSDVFALGVVAWEALTGRRLFRGVNEVETLRLVLATRVEAPSKLVPALGTAFDDVIVRALARNPEARFASARELGDALEAAARERGLLATAAEVSAEVEAIAGPVLERRRGLIRENSAPPASSVRVLGRVEATDTHDIAAIDAIDADADAIEDRGTSSIDVEFTGATASPASLGEPTGTLGSGVTAQSLNAVRDEPTPHRRARIAAALIAVLVAALGGAVALRPLSPWRKIEPIAPASAASVDPPTLDSPTVDPPQPTLASSSSPSSSPAPAAAPEPIGTSSGEPSRSLPNARAPATRVTPARQKPRAPRPDSTTPDRAPPNPYGQ